MSIIDDKNKLERLDQLVRLKATGTPAELANKFNITKRTIYRMINELKEIGCPIYFSKEQNSYCYEYAGNLLIKFEPINKENLIKIKGAGKKNNFFSDIFCHQMNIN